MRFGTRKGVKEGTYDSSVFLRYGEHSGQKDLQLKVSTNEINVIGLGYVISQDKKSGSSGSSSALVTVLVIVIALLVLVNLAWFFGSAEEAETVKRDFYPIYQPLR